MLSQMYTDNKHPLTHKFLIIRDDKTVITTDSSSESISGSMEVENSNKDLASSELDSDDFEDYVNEELSMTESQENISIKEETVVKTEYADNSIQYENHHDYYIKQEDTQEEEEQIYNSQVDNIAYNYLHSNLFLDET